MELIDWSMHRSYFINILNKLMIKWKFIRYLRISTVVLEYNLTANHFNLKKTALRIHRHICLAYMAEWLMRWSRTARSVFGGHEFKLWAKIILDYAVENPQSVDSALSFMLSWGCHLMLHTCKKINPVMWQNALKQYFLK